jgi:protein-S-isoprenylcysteine O-methyltransferase Ste14
MKKILRHLSSFAAPVIVCVVIPYLILRFEQRSPIPEVTASISLLIAGMVICTAGLALFILCVRMFILIGNGTIMPWDPTRKLITSSLYGYVRNPMILSVIIMVVGEAVLFDSYGIAVLAIFFYALNTIYFIFSEEPSLEKRFGAVYVEYKKNVPRWIPRLKPWRPE